MKKSYASYEIGNRYNTIRNEGRIFLTRKESTFKKNSICIEESKGTKSRKFVCFVHHKSFHIFGNTYKHVKVRRYATLCVVTQEFSKQNLQKKGSSRNRSKSIADIGGNLSSRLVQAPLSLEEVKELCGYTGLKDNYSRSRSVLAFLILYFTGIRISILLLLCVEDYEQIIEKNKLTITKEELEDKKKKFDPTTEIDLALVEKVETTEPPRPVSRIQQCLPFGRKSKQLLKSTDVSPQHLEGSRYISSRTSSKGTDVPIVCRAHKALTSSSDYLNSINKKLFKQVCPQEQERMQSSRNYVSTSKRLLKKEEFKNDIIQTNDIDIDIEAEGVEMFKQLSTNFSPLFHGKSKDDPIFTRKYVKGKPLTREFFNNHLNQICDQVFYKNREESRRKRVTTHTFRQAFIYRLLKNPSLHLEEIRKKIGHNDIKTTWLYQQRVQAPLGL